MALINQKAGVAQGNPNAELYKLASKQTYSACSAESVTAGSTSCYFNDVDTGTISMPCDYQGYVSTPTPNCSISHTGDYFGFLTGNNAGTGYDTATGLGSMNVANVVNAWTSTIGATAATVTVTPQYSTVSANNTLNVTVSVASSPTGGTTPTGLVGLTATGSTYSAGWVARQQWQQLVQPVVPPSPSQAEPPRPLGTETLKVSYGGDSPYSAASGTANGDSDGSGEPLPQPLRWSQLRPRLNSESESQRGRSLWSGNGSPDSDPHGNPRRAETTSPGRRPGQAVHSPHHPRQYFERSGTDPSTVAYSGDTNYSSATSSATTVTVIHPPSPSTTPAVAVQSHHLSAAGGIGHRHSHHRCRQPGTQVPSR